MTDQKIDHRILELYDQYCHSTMERRVFLRRAAAITIMGGSGLAMAQALLPDYAKAQTISFNDERITASYIDYESPGGNAPKIRGYLVQPKGPGPFPAIIVIHENRGLNPYIKDVARRAAVEGFLTLAPDALSPLGGYPGNDDEGKGLQRKLDPQKIHVDMLNGARFVRGHEKSTGKLGATGFCFGGGVTNYLAVEMGDQLQAAAPFYGRAPDLVGVAKIKASLVIHYAENDPRVNATKPDYESALKTAGTSYEMHTYPATNHGFHNNSTPRYSETAAKLAWQRTIDLFKRTLS